MARLERLVLLLVSFLALAACSDGDAETDEFLRVVATEPAHGMLARNESISILFNATPAEEIVSSPLLRLRGRDGEALPFRAATSGRTLVLSPSEGGAWPAETPIEVELDRGLALSLRAADGRPLKETSSHRFQVGNAFLDQGTPLRLVESPQVGERPLGLGAELHFLFNLPLDPTTLPSALRLIGEGESVALPSYRLEAEDRRLVVTPFAQAREDDESKTFTLEIGGGLRSSTGSSFLREGRRWKLNRARKERTEGVLTFEFISEALPREGNPPPLAAGDGARPQRGEVRAFILNDEARSVSSRRRDSVRPLSRTPSRFQMLIPAASLGPDSVLVTGLSFFVLSPPPAAPLYRRFLIRLGLLPEGQEGLQSTADANFAPRPAPVLTVSRNSREGEWEAPEGLHSGGGGASSVGWLDLDFLHAFPYPGGGRDLVVEFRNGGGCVAADASRPLPADWEGLSWVGIEPEGPARPLSLISGEDGVMIAENRVFATKVRIERYSEYVSDWEDALLPEPRFFRVPTANEIEARGVLGADFRFDFQGRRADGSRTPWGRLEALTGCRSIRCRLHFLPESARAAAGDVEVRRLRVRYE